MQRNAIVLGLGRVLRIESVEGRIGLDQICALFNDGLDNLIGNVVRQIVTRDQMRAEVGAPGRTFLAFEPFRILRRLDAIFAQLFANSFR